MLHYLARYVFRIAITNARIVGLEDAGVTFEYRDRGTGRRTCRLSGEVFMRRFLQHVLPRGFHKVRYFGLWHLEMSDTTDCRRRRRPGHCRKPWCRQNPPERPPRRWIPRL